VPRIAYLDNAATTAMRPEAVDAMLPFLTERYANPSGAHAMARDARLALDDARDVMAEALGCRPGEVVFTSGGTEGDNTAVFGAPTGGPAIVCSAIEHHAVLEPVHARGGRVVPVGRDGVIDLDALAASLDEDVALVSVMLVNNEIGTIQPFEAITQLVRDHAPHAVLHTDAVQAFPWLDVATVAGGADLVAVSAHKFGGPKGVGALVVRDGVAFTPRQVGGGQERERRSGTHNVAGIVGLAAALRDAAATRTETVARVTALRDRLLRGLLDAVPGAERTGHPVERVAGSCSLTVDGVESEALLVLLDRAGVCASAASACASGAQQRSHVLAAMGGSASRAAGGLRLSLGWCSTDADVDAALDAVPAAVAQLRRTAA
jgi:cysteine desulfurase